MKKLDFIIFILAVFIIILTVCEISSFSKRYTNLKINEATLLDSLNSYKIQDSINVAKISELRLSMHKYEKYFSENSKIVKKTKADKVESIINPKILTEIKIRTVFDTVYVDSARHFKYTDAWSSVNGIVYNNDSVSLNIKNTEELIVVTCKQKKKFLFFKLPISIFGYKNKQVDVISKNPRTTISNVSYVNID